MPLRSSRLPSPEGCGTLYDISLYSQQTNNNHKKAPRKRRGTNGGVIVSVCVCVCLLLCVSCGRGLENRHLRYLREMRLYHFRAKQTRPPLAPLNPIQATTTTTTARHKGGRSTNDSTRSIDTHKSVHAASHPKNPRRINHGTHSHTTPAARPEQSLAAASTSFRLPSSRSNLFSSFFEPGRAAR